MRATTCPVCVRHVRDLARHANDYAALGAAILVVVPEGLPTARAWAARQRLPFPVVTGAHGSPHEAIGLKRRWEFSTMTQHTDERSNAQGPYH
jgi:peroxiredoxin